MVLSCKFFAVAKRNSEKLCDHQGIASCIAACCRENLAKTKTVQSTTLCWSSEPRTFDLPWCGRGPVWPSSTSPFWKTPKEKRDIVFWNTYSYGTCVFANWQTNKLQQDSCWRGHGLNWEYSVDSQAWPSLSHIVQHAKEFSYLQIWLLCWMS